MVTLVPKTLQVQPVYQITDADKKRRETTHKAWKAYQGKLDPPLQKMPGEPDDNVLTNRCRAIVDRCVDFLFGRELEISAEEAATDGAQALLDAIWGRREARIPLLQKLAMSGAMAGQAFLRIVPGKKKGSFRLVVVDPTTIYVTTAPQDCETVLLYCIEYSTSTFVNGHPSQIYYREEISRIDPDQDDDNTYSIEDSTPDGIDSDVTWSIQHWTRLGDRGGWTASGDPILWSYPFPPIFSNQNLPNPHDFWGFPDIADDLIGIQNALNFVQSNINRINKLYSTPIIYATGVGASVVDIRPGVVAGLSDQAKVVAVNITSDLANALEFASNLRSDMDELSSVPGVATGRLDAMQRGTISGIAIELMFMPLTKKVDKKRCLYGELIINVSKALLALAGMNGDTDITLGWQNPLPNDDLQSVQAAVAKQPLGISNATLQRELGYDPDEEKKLVDDEKEDVVPQLIMPIAPVPSTVAPTPTTTPTDTPPVSTPSKGMMINATAK